MKKTKRTIQLAKAHVQRASADRAAAFVTISSLRKELRVAEPGAAAALTLAIQILAPFRTARSASSEAV